MTKKQVVTKCNDCERETYHNCLFSKRETLETEYIDFVTDYMVLQCAGCKIVSFLRRDYRHDALPHEEDQYDDYNFGTSENASMTEYRFLRDDDLDCLPVKIQELYEQVKETFRCESDILAGVGLRMLVEAVCLQQKIPGRYLNNKIIQLRENGLISKNEHPILDKLRLIGNDSAHNTKAFSFDKLSYALDIINHILTSIYIMPKINKKLKLSKDSK